MAQGQPLYEAVGLWIRMSEHRLAYVEGALDALEAAIGNATGPVSNTVWLGLDETVEKIDRETSSFRDFLDTRSTRSEPEDEIENGKLHAGRLVDLRQRALAARRQLQRLGNADIDQ